jgi:acyl carrier protein
MSTTASVEQVEETVRTSLESFGADPAKITMDATLQDLDIDSLDLAELAQIVEERFGVTLKSTDVKTIVTVGDAIELIAQRA